MGTKDVIESYYRYATSGDWSPWCDLFTENTVIDEQMAGHIEGREKLREMMAGFPTMYTHFSNVAVHIVVEGDEAMALSHITSVPAGSATEVQVDVANYFKLEGGLIAYMKNVHDTAPFHSASGE